MLSVSWEPLELTSGTPVMLPEEGPHAGRGVVERMAVIGQQITSAEEVVSARPALAAAPLVATRYHAPAAHLICALREAATCGDAGRLECGRGDSNPHGVSTNRT
jgi:hypothetical protein